jgi:hypothetical protein
MHFLQGHGCDGSPSWSLNHVGWTSESELSIWSVLAVSRVPGDPGGEGTLHMILSVGLE